MITRCGIPARPRCSAAPVKDQNQPLLHGIVEDRQLTVLIFETCGARLNGGPFSGHNDKQKKIEHTGAYSRGGTDCSGFQNGVWSRETLGEGGVDCN